jgi:hypothetical protein
MHVKKSPIFLVTQALYLPADPERGWGTVSTPRGNVDGNTDDDMMGLFCLKQPCRKITRAFLMYITKANSLILYGRV